MSWGSTIRDVTMLLIAVCVGHACGDDKANGWATSDGNTCVQCTYKSETFDKCGKWSTSYIWCCTKANDGNYINKQDSGSTINGWGRCDVEGTSDRPAPAPSPSPTPSISAGGPAPAPTPKPTPSPTPLVQYTGGYECSDGLTKQVGVPYCGSQSSSSCNDNTCCNPPTTCSDTNVLTGNSKCKEGSDKNYFFDLKKSTAVVTSDSDDALRSSCCTKCSAATCADWQTVKFLVGCGTGQAFDGSKALPSSDCSIPADADYKQTCCVTQPTTCSDTNVLTGDSKCKTVVVNDFFDLKKGTAIVASDGDDALRSACCTKCSAATCADWQTVKFLVGCSTGQAFDGSKALPSSDCSVPADEDYKQTCCVTPPTTCSDTNVLTGNSKCKAGSDINYFFDLKKSTAVVASDSDDALRSACCSQCSAATCADWQTVKFLVGCSTGQAFDGSKVLPSSDCSVPADEDYKQTCCVTPPTTCSDTNVLTGNSKCKAGSDINYFFDLKKSTAVVASDSDDALRSSCCSKCSAATCADWQTVKLLVGCGTGQAFDGSKALPSSDCSIPADADYKQTCCVTPPTTCSDTNVLTGNSKCKAVPVNDFFDLKKGTAIVASDSDDALRSSCCSQCSAATCADWQTVKFLVGCGTGQAFDGSKALPSSDCSVPADEDYKQTCCVTQPTTCSDTNVLTGNSKCKAGSDINYFFDLKKGTAIVASDSDDALRSACCTKCSAATCADWQTVKFLVGCGTGQAFDGSKDLPSSDCSVPADEDYKQTCCGSLMKCEDYADETSASHIAAFPLLGTLVASFTVLINSPAI